MKHELKVVIVSKVPYNKLAESVLKKKCVEKGMIYVGRESRKQRTYILFRCPKHIEKGIQSSAWCHFKDSAVGCSYCCGKHKTTDDFRREMADKNPDIIIVGEYSAARKKIECECKICGNRFLMIPNALLCGQGCPECGKRISKGERRVQDYLMKNNIVYYHNHIFQECRNKNPLIFDFYLPEYKVAIEYDGVQHFRNVVFFGVAMSNVDDTKKRDKIKDEFCIAHGIKMIRIPYYDYDNIENILNKEMHTIRSSETVALPMAT